MKLLRLLCPALLGLTAFTHATADVPFRTTTLADGAFAPTTCWYTMAIGSGGLVISDNGDGEYIALNRNRTELDDADLWCFTGSEADGFTLYNKQAGPERVLASPATMSGQNGGTAYVTLKDAATVTDADRTLWSFSASDDLGAGVEAYYMNQTGYAANKMNNRSNRLAFWTTGADHGSSIVIELAKANVAVDLTHGAFTAWNAAKTYASRWESGVVPGLSLSAGVNNMAADNEGIRLYSNSGGKTYTLTAPAGYVVTGYSFTAVNHGGQNMGITTDDGDTDTFADGATLSVGINGLNEQTVTFTVDRTDAASNAYITATNFTVSIARSQTPAEPSVELFQTFSGQVPYRIPAIARTHNGDVIAIADYRYCGADIGYGHIDLHARISTDNGATWGQEFTIADGNGIKGDAACGYGDAALVADSESDTVLVICAAGNVTYGGSNRQNPIRVARLYSYDNGRTWTRPVDITEHIYGLFDQRQSGAVQSLFFGSGRICQSRIVKTGRFYRLYAALCARGGNLVIYSDDFGQTWSPLGGENSAPAPSGDEPKCEELPDGTVVLSSRKGGGRYYNHFTYSDIEKAEGSWATAVATDACEDGIKVLNNSTNGEILIVPARRNSDGKPVYLALQSIPFGSGRTNVGIYYKALDSYEDFNTPTNFASHWEGRYQSSRMGSAYSTMTLQANDSIGFLYEESTYGADYTIVYKQYSIERITGGTYSYDSNTDRADLTLGIIDEKLESTGTGTGYVGTIDPARQGDIDAAKADFRTAPTAPRLYALMRTIEDATIGLVDGNWYRLVNAGFTGNRTLSPLSSGYNSRPLDEASADQLFRFSLSENGGWQLYNSNYATYVGPTRAAASRVSSARNVTAAGSYTLNAQGGKTALVCLNAGNGATPCLSLSASQTVVAGSADDAGARWYIAPATTLDVAVGELGYAAVYLPFGISLPADATAYALAETGNGYATLKALGSSVPAGSPFVLKSEADTVHLGLENDNSAESIETGLTGTFQSVGVSGNIYLLGEQDGTPGLLRRAETTGRVSANTAYLLDEALTDNFLAFRTDASVGIDHVPTTDGSATYYDIGGRPAGKDARGIVVDTQGGKHLRK